MFRKRPYTIFANETPYIRDQSRNNRVRRHLSVSWVVSPLPSGSARIAVHGRNTCVLSRRKSGLIRVKVRRPRTRVFSNSESRNGRTELVQRPSRSSARRPAVFRLARVSGGHFAPSGRRHCRRARDNTGQLINCYCSRFFFFFPPLKRKYTFYYFVAFCNDYPFYAK